MKNAAPTGNKLRFQSQIPSFVRRPEKNVYLRVKIFEKTAFFEVVVCFGGVGQWGCHYHSFASKRQRISSFPTSQPLVILRFWGVSSFAKNLENLRITNLIIKHLTHFITVSPFSRRISLSLCANRRTGYEDHIGKVRFQFRKTIADSGRRLA